MNHAAPSRANASNDRRKPRLVEEFGGGRVPPQALDVEEAVLGALMLEKDALSKVIDSLHPQVFYKQAHQLIFEAIFALFQASEPIDLITVAQQLRVKGNLDQVGGPFYISELTSRVASAANIEYHTHLLIQKYLGRELITTCDKYLNEAYQDTTDVFDLLDNVEHDLYQLSATNLRRESQSLESLAFHTIKQLEDLRNKPEGVTGVTTGFRRLDELTTGWQRSDLIIIAARPAMGKTAFVLSLARNAALLSKKPVALFSLEMSAMQLVQRLLGSEAEINAQALRTGKLRDYEWKQLHTRIEALTHAPIHIDDTPGLNLYDLRAKCRRLKSEKNIELVIIDYLQLMDPERSRNAGNREQEISAISRGLKKLAKELDVPVIALSQLSRAVETRGGDKRPMLSDLRESGAIEQDADMVMFLYRPEYYNLTETEDGLSTQGLCEVIIGKHRNGPTDTVRLNFNSSFGKFSDFESSGYVATPAPTKIVGSKMNEDLSGFDPMPPAKDEPYPF